MAVNARAAYSPVAGLEQRNDGVVRLRSNGETSTHRTVFLLVHVPYKTFRLALRADSYQRDNADYGHCFGSRLFPQRVNYSTGTAAHAAALRSRHSIAATATAAV